MLDFILELLASFLSLTSIYVGTTTSLGLALVAVGTIVWSAIMVRRRQWGLILINGGSAIIVVVNFFRLFS